MPRGVRVRAAGSEFLGVGRIALGQVAGVEAELEPARPVVNVSTAGAGAPVVMTLEDAGAVVVTVLALLAPVVAAVVIVVLLVLLAVRRWRRRWTGAGGT